MEICEVQSIYWQDLFYFPQAREIKRFSLFFFKYLVHSKENSWIISRQAEILTYNKCINVGQQCGPNYWLCEWLEYLDITIHLKIMLCGLLYQLTPHAPSSLIYICCKRVYKGLKLGPEVRIGGPEVGMQSFFTVGAQVQSLVGELRYCKLCGVFKKE